MEQVAKIATPPLENIRNKSNTTKRTNGKIISRVRFTNNKYYQQNSVFQSYVDTLISRSAPCIKENFYSVTYFLNYLESVSVTDLDCLTPEHMKNYENLLESKINIKEIKRGTAYKKLLRLSYFIKHLHLIQIINFKYQVTSKFKKHKIQRANQYVHNESRLELIEAIIRVNYSTMKRDLAIILLLIDLGCRPIEITNMRIKDVILPESSIFLYCYKSNQRKLKVDPFVFDRLKEYLQERLTIQAETDHLFLLKTFNPMNTQAIGQNINRYNRFAFGQIRFSAKALRHTFITNSLNDRNDIQDVAKTVGHKHVNSTMYYFYRSVEMLLNNTLPYNPMKGLVQLHES